MTKIIDIKFYIIIALFATIGGTTLFYKIKVKDLKHELKLSQKDEALCRSQKGALLYSIDVLNDITESQKIDYNSKMKEFENYKKHPKVIKVFRDINLTTENCNEIKDALDDIGTINYSDI